MAFDRIAIILNFLQEKHYLEYCNHYGEPGYTDPERGILFADWNPIKRRIMDELEKHGFELEWSDEWTIDYDCGKAYRHSPNSYSWQPSFIYTEDGTMITPDDDPSVWIEHCSDDRPRPRITPLPSRITAEDLMAEGYELFEGELENGWFAGQTDDPQAIAKRAFEYKDIDRVVFRKTEQSQFYIRFECWVQRETVGEDA